MPPTTRAFAFHFLTAQWRRQGSNLHLGVALTVSRRDDTHRRTFPIKLLPFGGHVTTNADLRQCLQSELVGNATRTAGNVAAVRGSSA